MQSITPKAGTLVLFPSYLEHKVNPNLSNEERIVISFNVSLLRKKDMSHEEVTELGELEHYLIEINAKILDIKNKIQG